MHAVTKLWTVQSLCRAIAIWTVVALFAGPAILAAQTAAEDRGGQTEADAGPAQSPPVNGESALTSHLPAIILTLESSESEAADPVISSLRRTIEAMTGSGQALLLTSGRASSPISNQSSCYSLSPGQSRQLVDALEPAFKRLSPELRQELPLRILPDLPAPAVSHGLAIPLLAGAQATTPSTDAKPGPVVAVLDTGVDYKHSDFSPSAQRIVGEGKCFTSQHAELRASCLCEGDDTCSPAPDSPSEGESCDSTMNWCDHGTHTAGVVARAVESARILSIQVNSKFENPGFCHDPGPCVLSFESDRIRALHWLFEQANQDGTKVAAVYVGQSAGSYRSTEECRQAHPCMQIAVDNLWSEGIPVIAPVGNDYRRDAIGAPACLENVISVGASQGGDQMAFFTNAAGNRDVPGRRMDVAEHRFFDFVAPGVEVETATPCADGVCRARISGTSMAAAHVAAAWVRLKQICSAEKPEVVLHALRSLSRRKIADLRGDEPAATGIPLVDVSTIDWSTAGQHCENAPNH